MDGFTQVPAGYCDDSAHPDQLALLFASGWEVLNSSGGCLGGPDSRAFAVAHVQPPAPVSGCDSGLCVVAAHMPHGPPTKGADVVQSVCEDIAQTCTVAFGDWNMPGDAIAGFWSALIGSSETTLVAPIDENTCCYNCGAQLPFDHLATNIASAVASSTKVYDYPIQDESPFEEHKPVFVDLTLPSSRLGNATSLGVAPRRLSLHI